MPRLALVCTVGVIVLAMTISTLLLEVRPDSLDVWGPIASTIWFSSGAATIAIAWFLVERTFKRARSRTSK